MEALNRNSPFRKLKEVFGNGKVLNNCAIYTAAKHFTLL